MDHVEGLSCIAHLLPQVVGDVVLLEPVSDAGLPLLDEEDAMLLPEGEEADSPGQPLPSVKVLCPLPQSLCLHPKSLTSHLSLPALQNLCEWLTGQSREFIPSMAKH